MAAGPLLAPATQELRALPANAPDRAVAEKILLKFQRFLEDQPHQTPTEQEFIKAMLKTWEDARAEGHAAGSVARRALHPRESTRLHFRGSKTCSPRHVVHCTRARPWPARLTARRSPVAPQPFISTLKLPRKATFLVLLPASAWARIIAPDFGF